MSYHIRITRCAEQDFNEALDHIELVFKNPAALDTLLVPAKKMIASLSENPKICPILDDPLLKSKEIRFFNINNYLAFYTIDEQNRIVYIVRFIYVKNDWTSIIKQDFSSK